MEMKTLEENLIYLDIGSKSYWFTYHEVLLFIIIFLLTIYIIYLKHQKKEYKPFETSQSNFDNSIIYIRRLMKKSELSELICTDIYNILMDFINNNTDSAYAKIYSDLIPHLKNENIIRNVGIAIGMLVDDIALSEGEALQITQKVMEEMVQRQ